MKQLLTAFFIVLLIAACSTGSQQDNNGQRIGTWMAYNNHADWVGAQPSNIAAYVASDTSDTTITVSQPIGFSIQLTEKNNPALADSARGQLFFMEFKDSTTTKQTFTDYDGYGPRVRIDNPFIDAGTGIALRQEYFVFANGMYVRCDSTYDTVDNIIVRYYEPHKDISDSTLLRTIEFNTVGLVQAAKSIHCY